MRIWFLRCGECSIHGSRDVRDLEAGDTMPFGSYHSSSWYTFSLCLNIESFGEARAAQDVPFHAHSWFDSSEQDVQAGESTVPLDRSGIRKIPDRWLIVIPSFRFAVKNGTFLWSLPAEQDVPYSSAIFGLLSHARCSNQMNYGAVLDRIWCPQMPDRWLIWLPFLKMYSWRWIYDAAWIVLSIFLINITIWIDAVS